MELASAESKVARKPSSWLLSTVHPQAAKEVERSLAGEAATGREALAASVVQLQVGWFSREENAKSLASILKSKGFSASVDARSTSDKEKRWAVIVTTKGDWTKTQAKLKDLGYESYLIP
jgi:cell division septation protein DedD